MGPFKHSTGTVLVLGLIQASYAEITPTEGSLQPDSKLWFLESAAPLPHALLGTEAFHVGCSHLLNDCKWYVAKDVTSSSRYFSVQLISIYGK